MFNKVIQKIKVAHFLLRHDVESCRRWWRFGDPSFHRFWLVHPCDRQTDGQNCNG